MTDYLTLADAAFELHISSNHLYTLIRNGQILAETRPGHSGSQFYIFDCAYIAELKAKRSQRLTVAVWHPGIQATFRGRRVVDVRRSIESANWYHVQVEGDPVRHRVYKNCALLEVT